MAFSLVYIFFRLIPVKNNSSNKASVNDIDSSQELTIILGSKPLLNFIEFIVDANYPDLGAYILETFLQVVDEQAK